MDVLLRALRQLKLSGDDSEAYDCGRRPGGGIAAEMVPRLELNGQVTFAGVKRGAELVRELNRHRDSGGSFDLRTSLSALLRSRGSPAAACVVGSEGGGLREAIGPCGMTFPNGDATALANCLRELLSDAGRISAFRNQAAGHLAHFTKVNVADAYLNILQPLCQGSQS